ncbi:MAG: hypothetical protein KJ968_03730 [Nanoarchaeota archaeon]|nr:hypothetical protein [Nanoarchaeota archaeon]MBU4284193.1 hypothetical protein [Nanoarchaeota archaeon]
MDKKAQIKSIIFNLGIVIIISGFILFAFNLKTAGKITMLIGIVFVFFGGLKEKLGL